MRRWCVAVVLAAASLAAGDWLATERPPAVRSDAGAALRSLSSLPPQGGKESRSLDSMPTQAQAVMSTALGRDDPKFAPKRSGAGFRLAGGGVAATFGRREVMVSARGGRSSIGLSSFGRGIRLRPLGAAAPRTRLNRVIYRHQAGVTEWYAAGPLGIEQGFTVARSPVGGDGPLTLALAAGGSLRPSASGSGAEFLTRSGRVALRYGGLTVLDASGRRLHAWLDASRSGLLLRVADRRAQYPLAIDPFIQEGPKLLTPRSSFGFSVAISGDGNTALVGGPSDGTGLVSLIGPAVAPGAAWVFVRSGSTWTRQAKLTGSDQSGDSWFGWSVALSQDGNTALIGGPTDDDNVGAAWVYTRSGSTWTQQGAKLTGSGTSGDNLFGWRVALSGDGNTALIGGPADSGRVGAAWVFTRTGTTWTQQGAKLTGASANGNPEFGTSVALSGDGNTALIGGAGDNGRVGAAWVFTRTGATWTQQGAKLTGAGEIGAGEFGYSAALSGNGNTALIGGRSDSGDAGAAWVFTRTGSTWAQQGAKLTGSGASGTSLFGSSVALSSDGNTALIGGPIDGDPGAAWAFSRSGSTWTQQGAKLTGSGASGNSLFGWSVALSGDGATAFVGGHLDERSVGAAWVFGRSGSTWAQQGSKLTSGSGEVGSGELGSSVALSRDGNVALVGAPHDNGNVGAVWVFTRANGVWRDQGPKLTGSGASGAGEFGTSVALSGDADTALIGGPGDNGNQGAAWVFVRSGATWAQQGSKLTPSDATGAGSFGTSVALSEDGATALIGRPGDNGNQGAAWVFTRSGSTWTQGPKLTGSGASGAGRFGTSVALSGDGATALVGAPFDSAEVGAAWVFTRSGSSWTQQGSKLTGADEVDDGRFGTAVALSGDGATALIGGPEEDGFVGAAWVFSRSGSTWTQQGPKLTGSSGAELGLFFGNSVALSEDGRTALIGAYGDDGTNGAAWVFTRSDSTWTREQPKLTPSDANPASFSQFGSSVALSGDGRTALIGGPKDFGPFPSIPFTPMPPIAGAAWVFILGDAPAITSPASATFRTGQPGSLTVTASGTPRPELSVGGQLPPGVQFVDNGDGTATLSGIPAAGSGGVYRFTIVAGNEVGVDVQNFTLTVEQPPAITSAAAATFATAQAGSFTIASSGFPAAALSLHGALPAGVSFTDNGDGTATLAGTPAAGTGGRYTVTITAANGVSTAATQTFTLTVTAPPAITSAAAATFAIGRAESFTVTTTGFPAPALSVQGALPAGVSFIDDGNGTARLVGTPGAGASGDYQLTITAANGTSSAATQEFTLRVGQTPAITSAAAARFTTGQTGSFTITTSGSPTPTLTARGGPLPQGVSYTDRGDGTASVAGTPAAGTGGVYRLTLTASNGISPDATQEFELTVGQPPAISPSGALFEVGRAGTFAVRTSGFPAPALSLQGDLPAGVSFTDDGEGSGILAGTPAAGTAGAYRLTITAANGVAPDATQVITLNVGQGPAITSAAAATFTTGQAGSVTVTTSGFPAPRLFVRGALPDGVTFTDNGDGTATVAGTPDAGAGGVYALTIIAGNGISSEASQDFTLTVEQPPGITSAAEVRFTTEQDASFTVTSIGFPAAALSVEGTLPTGVTFTDNGDGTAALGGVPDAGTGGVYPLTITAANGVSAEVTQDVTLTVEQPPAIVTAAEATFTTGHAASFKVASSGFPAPALSVQGALPTGVTFTDNRDGTAALAGVPAAGTGGVYPLTITAANDVSPAATQAFTLTVVAAPQPPAPDVPSRVAPASEALRLRALGLSVFGAAGSEARCRMPSELIRACTVRLVHGGRVLAKGDARRDGGARSLSVALQLTKRGRALLAERLGGVRARLRAQALTSAGARTASARTRALVRVERFTTPPGSWLPGGAALSERGERFLRGLRGRLVAVAALRCEGHSVRLQAAAVATGPLSRARAALLCGALAKRVGTRPTVVGRGTAEPIADNATEAGRAKNRRVVVTVTHRPRRLP